MPKMSKKKKQKQRGQTEEIHNTANMHSKRKNKADEVITKRFYV